MVEAGAKIIEVNYSCPNKFVEDGGAVEPVLGYDLNSMFEIDERIVEQVGRDITIIRKLPPPVGEKRILLPEMAVRFGAIGEPVVNGEVRVVLAAFNTIGGQQVLDEMGDPALSIGENKDNIGGLSGRAFAEMAVDGLRRLKKLLPESVGTISSVGVDSAYEIYHRVDEEDADFTEGVTVLWENERKGKKFGQTITELAEGYFELHKAA